MAIGVSTFAISGITTADTGTHTTFTVAAYTLGEQFAPGQYVQISTMVNGGTGLGTNIFNGVFQVIACPTTTTLLVNVPFPTGATYVSGGVVQPLAPIAL